MKQFILLGILSSWLLTHSSSSLYAGGKQRVFFPSSSYNTSIGIFVASRFGSPAVPIYGFVPNYYQGFYNNGFSAYGQGIPTNGTTPGFFDAADQKYMGSYSRFYGLNYFGYRSPSPRPVPNFNYIPKGVFDPEPAIVVDPKPLPCTIEVVVPTDAILKIDGETTKSTGKNRVFTTPSIPPSETYTYTIQAQWTEAGKPVTRGQLVKVQGGNRVTVDLISR